MVTDVWTATLLQGQGIGEEVTNSMLEVFEAARAPVLFDKFSFGKTDKGIPEEVDRSLLKNLVAVKGPFYTPVNSRYKSVNILLRTKYDLYANVVHCFNVPGVETRHKNIDIVMIRENTEGEYSGLEHEAVPGVVESLKIISREKSLRIAEYAFKYAVANNRKKITCVHKANIMKLADGLFLQCCEEVAAKYPYIEFDSMIVDNTCMQMASRPQQFDVMLLPNLYGNIVTNIAAGLVGGPGLFPGANISDHGAIFEQGARHAATRLAGQNIANPTATILAGVMLLRYLKLNKYANVIEQAVLDVYKDSNVRTRDVGGNSTITDFTKAVINRLEL